MAAGWSVPLDETPQLVAGALMLAVAGFVLVLRFSARVNRALALYLVLAGTREVIGSLDDPLRAPALTVWVFRTIPWFNIAIPFAAAHLAVRYAERESGRRAHPAWGWALLAGAVTAELAYLVAEPVNAGSYAVYLADPFIVFYAGLPLLLACLGLDFARRARRAADPARRRAFEIAAIAFAAHAAFAPALATHYFYRIAGPKPLLLALTIAAVVPVVLTAIVLARGLARGAFALAVPLAAGVAHALYDLAFGAPSWTFRLLDGAFRMALPALLLYSILRHRLFDIDVKVRWTISRGTLAALFVAVFFVVSESAATFLQGFTGGPYLGIAAAGLLVFAIAPLQRLAERVAEAAVPGARSARAMTAAERLDVYRAAVRDAWRDGSLDASERRLLETFRARLGLTHEEAARVELEAAAGAERPGALEGAAR